jgi:hypothetical protein
LLLAVLLGASAACERPSERVRDEQEMVGRVLRGTPAYPASTPVSYGAGDEAAEIALTTPASPEVVTAWYRESLPAHGWIVLRQSRDRSGAVTLYAEREQRPLWVRLSPSGTGGTAYTLVGVALKGDTVP